VLKQCTKYSNGNERLLLSSKKEQDIFTEAHEIGRKGLRGKFLCCVMVVYLSNYFISF